MSVVTYSPAGLVPISYIGINAAHDQHIPVAGKDEWGMDTLFRTVRMSKAAFATYLAALDQGDIYTFDSHNFYLQTWQPFDGGAFPGVTLNYKGLTKGLPDPLESDDRVELVSSVSDEVETTYNEKDVVGASKTVRYVAPQTTYRYITSSRPTTPTHSTTNSANIEYLDSKVTLTFSDGSTQVVAGSVPSAVISALAGSPEEFVIGPIVEPVPGTIYFECVDVVRYQLPSDG